MTIDSRCARCLRPAPDEDSDEFATWEVQPRDDENSGRLVIICEDCLTAQEQQAMAGEDEATAEAATEFVRREHVPDLEQVAGWLLADLQDDEEAQGHLDAIGTLTGLTEDDLVGVAILLGRRLVEHEDDPQARRLISTPDTSTEELWVRLAVHYAATAELRRDIGRAETEHGATSPQVRLLNDALERVHHAIRGILYRLRPAGYDALRVHITLGRDRVVWEATHPS